MSAAVPSERKALVLSPRDNVATALADLEAGETVAVQTGDEVRAIALQEPIRFGHKFALIRIERHRPVFKYGEEIGRSTRPIAAGEHVHVHNLESLRGRGDLR
jgi:altronate dehydratase small subunit